MLIDTGALTIHIPVLYSRVMDRPFPPQASQWDHFVNYRLFLSCEEPLQYEAYPIVAEESWCTVHLLIPSRGLPSPCGLPSCTDFFLVRIFSSLGLPSHADETKEPARHCRSRDTLVPALVPAPSFPHDTLDRTGAREEARAARFSFPVRSTFLCGLLLQDSFVLIRYLVRRRIYHLARHLMGMRLSDGL